MKKIFFLCLIGCSQISYAEIDADSAQGVCYLPTQSEVSFSEVTDLPVESPTAVLDYGQAAQQFGELWLPKSAQAHSSAPAVPLVVLIHGGCWLNAFSIGHTHALSTALSQAGYAVWSVEYRRTGDEGGGWPGSYHDIVDAVNFLPELSSYPIDLGQVAIAGHSAGGHLALLAGANKIYDFKAVIGLAAIVDLELYATGNNSCQLATPKFMGGIIEDKRNAYQTANPARREVHKSTVLIHGDKDSIVPFEHIDKLKARSVPVSGGGHFDMIHPGTPSYQALLRELAKAFAN